MTLRFNQNALGNFYLMWPVRRIRAIVYTLIECCRRRGLNPFAYLRDVLTRLPNMTNRQIHEVTPEAWSKSRRTAQPQPAA